MYIAFTVARGYLRTFLSKIIGEQNLTKTAAMRGFVENGSGLGGIENAQISTSGTI
jgi:hypothetical protein